jgi:hypothetical protein
MEVSDQLLAAVAITRGENFRYPLEWRRGGLQSRSGCACIILAEHLRGKYHFRDVNVDEKIIL